MNATAAFNAPPHPIASGWKSISLWAIDRLQEVKLEGLFKAVLWTLLKHHNDRTGQCNPSLDRMAACAGWCKNTIRKVLGKLETLGLITSVRLANSKTKQWNVNFEAIDQLPQACRSKPKPRPHWQPQTPTAPTSTPTPTATAATTPVSATTLRSVNAQRRANGKRHGIQLAELLLQAQLAGITPQQAAEWILAKPKRNFFRAEFYQAEQKPATPPTVATPAVHETPTPASRPPASVLAQMDKIRQAAQGPIRSTCSTSSAVPLGSAPDKRWAHTIVDNYLSGATVSSASVQMAAHALGVSVADLRTRRVAVKSQ